ncbi:heteromeric transposase endonuclease subunit TnsA [Halobacillus trueperi]|uniref:Heteromeric transposase endonuclease subunit TnsA n=1 Tax=Halobacillus trueperi TaxID=156205 RepID=A0A3D8VUA3_9BACI|nr:TnsA endonuclease N-terminal domain-containing protein [Halobacillus trueperi]RDY72588.1 heteromeric transposase endonuclease subunit TnsA [Halobacillus trueperi]
MAKRKTSLTEKKIKEMYKEGRGQGVGESYKPWITIQDVPSMGLSTREKGWKTDRIHQFLSKLERDFFYLLEWADSVIDIREQFPLNREDTYHIAEEKEIEHPLDPTTKVPIVMTTDFLITVRYKKGTKLLARTIKPSKELEKKRVIEKFEVERSYWETRGVDWGIVTEKEIPKGIVQNVEWLHASYSSIEEISEKTLQIYTQNMVRHLNGCNTSIIEMVSEFDRKFHLDDGMSLDILKHLIARKEVKVDISRKIFTHQWVEDVFVLDSK